MRELLTHTAGLTVHGFPGYAAGARIPTLVQVLNGEKPANTAPVRLERVVAFPQPEWHSGGGKGAQMDPTDQARPSLPMPAPLAYG